MLSLSCVMAFLPLIISFISLLSPEKLVAAASNRTIDDEFGDSLTGKKPIFLPNLPGIWAGQECTTCSAHPDKTKAFNQTYNSATYRPEIGYTSIELDFRGTAIYVYFIIANTIEGGNVTTLTECNFTMDGEHAGYYRHDPTPTTDIEYHIQVFRSENLPNTDHSLNISTSGIEYHTFTTFDYAIYTFDDSPSTPLVSVPLIHIHPPTVTSTTQTSISNSSFDGLPTHTISSPTIQPPTSTSTTHTNISNPIDSAPSNKISVPGNKNSPTRKIVGGSVGGVVLILLGVLLFISYRRKKWMSEIELAAAVAAPGPDTTAAAITPFTVIAGFGFNYPSIAAASGKSSTAPMNQRPVLAAQNLKFPLGRHVNSHRDDAIHRIIRKGRLGWRQSRRGETQNVGSSRSESNARLLATGDEPIGAIPTSAEIGHVGGDRVGISQTTHYYAPNSTNFPEVVDGQRPQRSQRHLGTSTNHSRSEDAEMGEQMQLMQEERRYLSSFQDPAGPPPEYSTFTGRGVGGF